MGCRSTALPRHSWVTGQAEALTVSAHLAGANTRSSSALGGVDSKPSYPVYVALRISAPFPSFSWGDLWLDDRASSGVTRRPCQATCWLASATASLAGS